MQLDVTMTERVRDYRAVRAGAVAAAVQAAGAVLPGTAAFQDPIHFALLHHSLLGLRYASRRQDETLAEDVIALWEIPGDASMWCPTELGAMPLVEAERCVGVADPAFLSIPFVITGRTADAGSPRRQAVADAIRTITSAGMISILQRALGAIVLLRQIGPTDESNSYSVTALPGTVFVDCPPDPFRLGESILHEAAHCWLNECLRACHEELPLEPKWYSPWKQEMRPAFGILHAGYAFSLVYRYLDAVATDADASERARAYARTRIETESKSLRDTSAAIAAALSVVRSDDVRRLIEDALLLAVDPH